MAIFKGFKPQAMQKIAGRLGYTGSMADFDNYLEQNPEKKRQMIVFQEAAKEMARGGYIRMQTGGMPSYANPINTGGIGAAVMQYGYNPTTNQYSISGGGGQQFPEGFESSGSMEEIYKKYPNIRGVFEQGVPKSINPPYSGKDQPPLKLEQVAEPARPVDPRDANTTGTTRGPGLGSTTPIDYFLPGTNPPLAPGETRMGEVNPKYTGGKTNVMEAIPVDPRELKTQTPTGTSAQTGDSIGDVTTQRMFNPALPTGGVVSPFGIPTEQGQMLQQGAGQVSGTVSVPTAMAQTTMANQPTVQQPNTMNAQGVAEQVNTSLDTLQAAQTDPRDPRTQVLAAQQTASSVGNLASAQGNAILMSNPVQREIQQGELIDTTANAEKAKNFTEQIEAATTTVSDQATVAGQLAGLTTNFDASNPPAWAAGAIRGVQAVMQQRGLGASSIAGQALVQAAMESALPIAQADANTVRTFELQNLSNRQQRAMLAAQQRATFIGQEFDQSFQARVQNSAKIADIANRNFTAEQQIALENSRVANTVNLNNLSNRQALVMAEASALANLDTSNLTNRQQSAVQNAQNFLQIDMANLSNQQQSDLFKAQQRTQSLFTDQAAENASRQFNATSQNQLDQFFANLGTQVAQFNATQANAQSQFNAGQANTVERFNAELNNQRDQFNAQNQLVIGQSNAQWRRQIATADTASVNRANELNANAILNISKSAYDNLWQYYADTMEWAWTSAENELDRISTLAEAQLDADAQDAASRRQAKSNAGSAVGGLIGTLGAAAIQFCWVAREVYGVSDLRWVKFRYWMLEDSPKWLHWLYTRYGQTFAKFIKNKPIVKSILKRFMDKVI